MDKAFCISVKNLTKTVDTPAGRLDIVQQVSLDVKYGEALVITGASGSGKTTLLGLMAGLDSVTNGSIELLGHDLNGKNEEQRAEIRRGEIGFVFQSFQLVNASTALQNVLLPLQLAGVSQAREKAQEAIEQVGLADRADTLVDLLSGGEQQRVAIARAFAVEPRILFADEPTGNLDVNTGEQISDLMFSLRDQRGVSLVMVTHEPGLASRGDRHIEMNAGRIVEH